MVVIFVKNSLLTAAIEMLMRRTSIMEIKWNVLNVTKSLDIRKHLGITRKWCTIMTTKTHPFLLHFFRKELKLGNWRTR